MTKVYLDTNAFYFFFFEDEVYSPAIRRYFSQMHEGRYSGFTSALTLDELAYVVLLRLIEKQHKQHPIEVLRRNRSAMLEFMPKIKAMFDAIFSFNNLTITDATRAQAGTMPEIMEAHNLLPRDALHICTAKDHGCEHILTTDSDFDNIPGMVRMSLKI